ncbi:MAG TPA: hypothetical protein VGG27_04865 [Magnetospirillaceae bacterium]
MLTFSTVVGYPEEGRWIGFAATVGLAAIDGARHLYKDRSITIDLLDMLLAALIAFGALSLLWSANVNGGIQTVIIAGACLLFALYLKRYAPRATTLAIALGAGSAIVGSLVTNLWLPAAQWSGFGNSGYAAEALILCLPFLWPLWRLEWEFTAVTQILAVVIAAAAIGYIVAFTPSAIGAFVLASFAAIASLHWAFRRSMLLGWGCAALWLIIPPIVAWFGWEPLQLTERILVRAELWLNAGFMILDRPLFGHGAGSFIEVYPLFKEAHGDLLPFVNKAFESYVTEAEALHNETLQLWTELGTAGLLLLVAFYATALKAAAARFRHDVFAQAGGAALLAALAESFLEYPFQRAATLFLAVIALAFATRDAAPAIPQWRLKLARPVAATTASIAAVAAVLLLVASYRQFEAERRLDQTHAPGIDPVIAFNLTYEAHRLDPLDRRIRAALPIMLDGVIRARGLAAVPRATVDQIYRDVDNGARYNTSALVAHAQYLLEASGGDDPSFLTVLADLKRGSSRVAAAYAIEARYLIAHRRFAEAVAVATTGQKYTDGVSSIPSADAAIKANLAALRQLAERNLPH